MPDGTFVEKKAGAPSHGEANHSPVIDEDWGEMTSEAIMARCTAGAPRNAFVRSPLFRRAYLLLFVVCTLLVLVPLWTLLYLPRANRPRRSWTLKRCLRVRWSRRLCAVVARCEIDYLGRDLSVNLDPLTLEWSHPVTLQPAPAHWLRGHAAAMLDKLHKSRGNWVPHFVHRYRASIWGKWNPPAHAPPATPYGFAPVPAFWYTGRKASPTSRPRARHPGDPVLLMFHGGGYVLGTAAESDLTSSISKAAVQHTPVRHILSVDYRLAGNAPWPLPLLDAISAYHHIVKVEGVDECDLLLGGDSAGAHLALALARYLRDEGRALGLNGPRGIILLSPWSDVGFTHSWGTDAFSRNAESDTIDNSLGPFAVSLLLRALPASLMHTSTYLSPSSQLIPAAATGPDSFENFPPVFVVCGGAERLESEIHELFHRILLARDKPLKGGVGDELVVRPDAVHDFMIFPHFADEAAVVFEHMDDWLRQLLLTDSESDGEAEAAGAAAEEVAAKSPELFATSPKLQAALARRESHRASRAARASLLVGKSPRLRPYRDTPRLMYGDMQAEGLHLIDIPPLDLDALHLPQSAAEIFTPFTSQMEKGEWDFGEGEEGWYEGGGSGDDEVEEDDEDLAPVPELALPPPVKLQPRRRR
ncbi:hypothetical protein Q8F55_008738 [Vanrija albida]|uniref:Alpha/beta hydrolase fold-3 domain-containing protein n=1 Tax=Vanrija albida TaxID=181172 RepID=A0ABR3PRN0_9TREE